ncbi:hypothetical protein [Umezawaea sp. Da 62-37]|uniref:hypothetical protein n=1 Tax=Umezawaea sp. Da 62-37 TaxID=3075927 RepID=UPI0028F73E60|nr:hypothetical protein [Umezawaea sp. Da 62-37]WNV83925.1 hypothetical protein RM788_38040 [Umezawaea sp. Da 62-37]
MDIKKTITGAAIALGGAVIMLGSGGTASAAVDGDATAPHLGHQLNEIIDAEDLSHIDTENPLSEIRSIHLTGLQDLVSNSIGNNRIAQVDAQADDSMLGVADNNGPSRVATGVDLNRR